MKWFALFIRFGKNVWGIVQKPYQSYRALGASDPYELLILFFVIGVYFFLVSPLRLHTFHPFLLTLNTSRLFTTAIATYLGICLFFAASAKIFKSTAELRSILLSWGYSLIPTLMWFLATSFFYVFLPPPRHETLLGRSFSLLYIAFSLSLFFWKGMLYYLTLRFALKFDLKKIIAVSAVFFPLLALYSWGMYRLGIFRVPFV